MFLSINIVINLIGEIILFRLRRCLQQLLVFGLMYLIKIKQFPVLEDAVFLFVRNTQREQCDIRDVDRIKTMKLIHLKNYLCVLVYDKCK